MVKLILTAFFMAWGMFWTVPCPVKRWDERARVGMLLFLPVFGLLIGALWGLCAWLRERFLPGLPGAALLAAALYMIAGFLHLDGYMDCADAVLSRRDQETRRRILKDSHVGSFAVVAVVILFLILFAALADGRFTGKWMYLPLVCAGPRAACGYLVLSCRPMPGSSYERMFSGGVPAGARFAALAVIGALAIFPAVFLGRPGWCAFAGEMGALLTAAYIRHDLGGMSGDVSGAGITVGELCALAALVYL